MPNQTRPAHSESPEPSQNPEPSENFDLSLELVQALAQQIDLQLPPESVTAVRENWLTLAAMVHPLLELELPQSLDLAPRFEP